MNFRSILTPALFASLAFGGLGSFPVQAASSKNFCLNPHHRTVRDRLKPLADLIARGEGNYNSVNRGYAGDTPGGIQSLTGMTFENYTVGQIVSYQHSWLHAVGRYQLIPSTFRFAVANSDVSPLDMFTPEVQDKLMVALVLNKRPAVGDYLKDRHDSLGLAMDEMAREWASIEYRSGRGYYDHTGGNRAHISRSHLAKVLRKIKTDWYFIT